MQTSWLAALDDRCDDAFHSYSDNLSCRERRKSHRGPDRAVSIAAAQLERKQTMSAGMILQHS
jgi:hypothetical protein